MLETARQVLDIQTVSTIQPSNSAMAVGFGNGLVTRVPPGHSDGDNMLREATSSLEQGRPVGVMASGNGLLLELSHAHDTAVRSMREDEEDKSRLAVWLWEYSPVCYLTRDHPEFDRIRATLEQAAASGTRVWLANHMHMVEGEAEVWWKIMDVRPIESLPPRT